MLSIAIIVAVAGMTITADFCAERARSSMVISNWTDAEPWLNIGHYCRGSHVRLLLIQARLANKRGAGDQLEAALEAARLAGASATIIQRERLLVAAAAGQIEPLKAKLSDLLAAGEDLQEICEAYAIGCLSNYQLNDAAQILDLWQADFSEDPRPHLLRGRMFEHRPDFERASIEFQTAWRLSPNYAPAAYNQARILSLQNRNDEAVTWYRLAAKNLTEPQPALVGEASCLRQMERNADARQILLQVRSRPSKRQEIDEAYRIVGEPIESAATQVLVETGQIELAEKNYAAACAVFSEALASNPRDWRTRYAYSIALRQSGDVTQADLELERVESAKQALDQCDHLIDSLHKNPRNAEARYQIGVAIIDHVSENQGLIWLNSVLLINPHHAATHRKLAEYFEANAGRNPDFAQRAEWHHQQAGK